MAETQTILVALDGSPLSEQVIPYAARLVGSTGTLVFTHVVPEPESLHGLFGDTIATEKDMGEVEQQSAESMLNDVAERWADVLQVEAEIRVVIGTPADEIAELAHSESVAMIAMASRGRGAIGRIAFGSVADRITRSSPIPVLIVHPQSEDELEYKQATIARFVVPLDGSDTADQAIPLAVQLAKANDASIHVVQAIQPGAMMMPAPMIGAYYPPEMYDEFSDDLTQAAQSTLSDASKRVEEAGIACSESIVEGPAVSSIESVIDEGDWLVMASHGRGGVERWLLGSVAEKLIQSGVAPVVLVPAAGRGSSQA